MTDELDLVKLGTHAATGMGGAGVVAAFMRWVAGRESQEVATRLALIEQKLDMLMKESAKHDGLSERVALMEASLRAVHDRLDGKRGKR